MKSTWCFLILLMLACFFLPQASAHQPRLVMGKQVIEIKRPEVSQAFYSALLGAPDIYTIKKDNDFLLYLNILVPKLPEIKRNISLEIFAVDSSGSERFLFALNGEKYCWEDFFEPFAGDRYFKGPEAEAVLSPGMYKIKVFNPGNTGKYVLAVGKEETFTLPDAVDTVRRLPALKRYFGKSAFTAYLNLTGLMLLILGLLFAGTAIGLYHLIKIVARNIRF